MKIINEKTAPAIKLISALAVTAACTYVSYGIQADILKGINNVFEKVINFIDEHSK